LLLLLLLFAFSALTVLVWM